MADAILDAAKTEHQFLLGLSKSGKAVGTSDLEALSLLAQRRKFDRPARPEFDDSTTPTTGGDPILPPEARRALLAVAYAARDSDFDRPIVDALQRARVRLHPFDLPKLEGLVRRQLGRLGAEAQSWARAAGLEVRFDPVATAEVADESTYGKAGKAAKLAYLRQLRLSDLERVRAYVEAAIAQEPANFRADLPSVLQVALAPADEPLLRSLAADRSKPVRDASLDVLGRLPGTEEHKARLHRVRDTIRVKSAGLAFWQKKLEVDGGPDQNGNLHVALRGLRVADIAGALGLKAEDLVDLAAQQSPLDMIMLRTVLDDGRYELVSRFIPHLGGGWIQLLVLLNDLLDTRPESEWRAMLSACIVPHTWTVMPDAPIFHELSEQLGQPLPIDLAATILKSSAVQSLLDAWAERTVAAISQKVDALAPLIPRELSERFIAELGPLAPRAENFHRLLLALPNPQ